MKRTTILLCLALILLAALAFYACNQGGKLPSLHQAQMIRDGMTYFEAVEILGSWGAGVPTSVWRHEWELSNGQFLLVGINDGHFGDVPTLYEVQIVDESWGGNGVDTHLRTMKVFDTIAEYNEYASGPYQLYSQIKEPYEDAEPDRSSPYYIYASALRCLGEFERYYYAPFKSGPNRYYYFLTDDNGAQIKVEVHLNRQTIPYLEESTPYLETLPQGTANMCAIKTDTRKADYDRNGLLYSYTNNGELSSVKWIDNNVCFTLSGDLDKYPMDGKDTLVKGMLSVSEQEAQSAWNALKAYVQNNNKKPLPWKQILLWAGVAVLVAGAVVAAFLTIRKKQRKRATVAVETEEALGQRNE